MGGWLSCVGRRGGQRRGLFLALGTSHRLKVEEELEEKCQ
jgi:hypothetical protein